MKSTHFMFERTIPREFPRNGTYGLYPVALN